MPNKSKNGLPSIVFTGLCLIAYGCGTSQPSPSPVGTPAIPNLRQFAPGEYRGGQPLTKADFVWLQSVGVSNVIKLNTPTEGTDSVPPGMTVYQFPIDTMQQLVSGPDPVEMQMAVSLITPGTFVHCSHGQDRTGLLVGLYRLKQGWAKTNAYTEMLTNGFHPALHGLHEFWENAK